MRGKQRDASAAAVDSEVARIAAGQHGVVHLDQLLGLGLPGSTVRSRVKTGRLHRVHRGVYAVGHPLLTREGRCLAAVFAAGPGAALSHLAGAALLGVRRWVVRLDVSVPRPGGRRLKAIRIHRVGTLDPREVCTIDSIPTTTLPRTLIDIAPLVGQREVERAIAEAQHLGIYDRGAMQAAIERSSGRRGAGILREILSIDGIERTLTNQELEERFLALVRAAGLPLPLVNLLIPAPGGPYKCDFVWTDARLIVETDGRGPHMRDRQFEEDRRRDSNLKLAGWEVIRFTWRQVVNDPEWVISVVLQMRERRKES